MDSCTKSCVKSGKCHMKLNNIKYNHDNGLYWYYRLTLLTVAFYTISYTCNPIYFCILVSTKGECVLI